jgi:hypothetical protein
MFVQFMHGKTKDPAGMRKQMDKWVEELRPEAKGFIGSTSGITDDGEFVVIARFENEEIAMQNSESPKQTEWWNETSQYIDGEAKFHNFTQTDTMRGGGSDDAGFVQVMEVESDNMERAGELGKEMDQKTPADYRPEYLGGTVAWDDKTSVMVAYFTSEKEARAGEQLPPPEGMAELNEEMGSLMKNMKYYDLREPNLIS